MKKIKHILAVGVIAFLLASCQLFPQPETKVVKPPVDVVQPPDDVIETPPQIVKKTDWNTILSPFINKLLHPSVSYDGNNVILISDIQNRSGDYIATSQIDETLRNLMGKQNTFVVVGSEAINQAKQALGISYDDKLVSRSKMIGLAKSINVGYVLFTTIYKVPSENSDANLSMELLSTQTGEILQRVTSSELESAVNSGTDSKVNGVGE